MGFSPGGGGSSSVSASTDVALSNPANSEVLTYDSTAGKWQNKPAAGGTTITANAQTASYTLVMADAGKSVEVTSASATTVTIPTNASVAFPVGTIIEIGQFGTGQVTIAGAGVTLQTAATLVTRAQYSLLSIRKRATDTWVISGDLG